VLSRLHNYIKKLIIGDLNIEVVTEGEKKEEFDGIGALFGQKCLFMGLFRSPKKHMKEPISPKIHNSINYKYKLSLELP